MLFSEFLAYLNYLFVYSSACVALPMNTPLCSKFWGVCFLIAIIVFSIVFIQLLRKILKDRSDWNKYLLKVENRQKIAGPEIMAKHVWTGDY